MVTIAAALKKELKQTFKGTNFSVTSKRDDVRVEWEMTLGTAATKQAVKEICKRYETVEHHGSPIDDTAWSSGTSIYCYPSYTQERENWAVAGVIEYNFADVTWEPKYERFVQSDGKDHYHATKLYYSYLENGVASELVDEYGQEPSHKRWYYEKLNPPAPQPEPELVEAEIEAPIIPLAVYKVESEVYIQANFPSGNKRHWTDEYQSQATNLCQAKIIKVVQLSQEDYQAFIYSFLNNQDWLAGEGGGGSHYVSEKYGNDRDRLFSDELEAKKWRHECYEISVLVTDGNIHYVLVNPEGHNYARYVGLPHHVTLNWVLEKCNLQLIAAPTKPTTINKSKTATMYLTDEEWEAEEARIETRLIEIERDLSYTKPEEDQLRAELAALRQISHTPTNKSCYYCHSDEYASIRDKSYRCYVCNPETQSEQSQSELETMTSTTPKSDPIIELYNELITTFKGVEFLVKPEGIYLSPWI